MASKYQAVSIRFNARACEAVKRTDRERFLALEAPNLPVDDCSNRTKCKCRYQHFSDRRDGLRRDKDFGLPGIFWTTEDRRGNARGRRATDLTAERTAR